MSKAKVLKAVEAAVKKAADQLRRGKFKGEEAVKQCTILPILRALKWDTDTTDEVLPQFKAGGYVDYALFARKGRELQLFIEAKAVGKTTGKAGEASEKQLFGYARKKAPPILILTDGKIWNFYLPTAKWQRKARQFHKINITEHEPKDVAVIFYDYLFRNNVVLGRANKQAQEALKSNKRMDAIKETMPKAWQQLLEEDDSLRELLAEKVEDFCGYNLDLDSERDLDIVEAFLLSRIVQADVNKKKISKPAGLKLSRGSSETAKTKKKLRGFVYCGKTINENTAISVLEKAIVSFSENDRDFPKRLANRTNTDKVRLISESRESLYMSSPHLIDSHSREIEINSKKWWLSRCYSKARIIQHLKTCCEVAGVKYGKDFKIIEE